MSDEPESPIPYEISYPGFVRSELVRLGARAKAIGLGKAYYAAVQEMDRRLRIYPQFGEPIIDLVAESGRI